MNLCSVVLFFLISVLSGPETSSGDGKASYYADRFHGQRTANGERYDKTQLTAAHASLPFDTKVQVTNLRNGKSVVVRINDRMARSKYRIIDLSKAAAKELDMIRDGTVTVSLAVVPNEPAQQDTPVAVSDAEPMPQL
jgi:rare lipoprotein A